MLIAHSSKINDNHYINSVINTNIFSLNCTFGVLKTGNINLCRQKIYFLRN